MQCNVASGEKAMGKVGRFVTDPKAGAYCDVTLDNGDKLVVNHDKGGFKGGHLSLEKKKWMGLGSERVFAVDLDSPAGKQALARLTEGVPTESARATPLGAFAEYVKDCRTVDDVKAKCEALLSA
jgi:hypothetical protein